MISLQLATSSSVVIPLYLGTWPGKNLRSISLRTPTLLLCRFSTKPAPELGDMNTPKEQVATCLDLIGESLETLSGSSCRCLHSTISGRALNLGETSALWCEGSILLRTCLERSGGCWIGTRLRIVRRGREPKKLRSLTWSRLPTGATEPPSRANSSSHHAAAMDARNAMLLSET